MLVLEIRPASVWRRLGVADPRAKFSAEARAVFGEAYERACAALNPRFTTRRVGLQVVGDRTVELAGGAVLESADLARLVTGGNALVVMAVTVGEELDVLVEEYNGQRETFAMAVVDAVGSAAAEGLMRSVYLDARREAAAGGEMLTKRMSPGYGDFPLSVQPTLLKLVGGEELGITLTENFMMVPRKSVTAVAGVKPL